MSFDLFPSVKNIMNFGRILYKNVHKIQSCHGRKHLIQKSRGSHREKVVSFLIKYVIITEFKALRGNRGMGPESTIDH